MKFSSVSRVPKFGSASPARHMRRRENFSITMDNMRRNRAVRPQLATPSVADQLALSRCCKFQWDNATDTAIVRANSGTSLSP